MDDAAIRRRVAGNLAIVQDRIARAAGGREVALCCVTKYAQLPWIEALLEAGARHLAENLLPQAAERFSDLAERGYRFTRHLIGAQQSRKLRLLPGRFDWFQAVDRGKTALLLEQELAERDLRMEVLLEVNIAREEQKHGVLAEDTAALAQEIAAGCPHLQLRGLMAVPPWPAAYPGEREFEAGTRRWFGEMRSLFDTIGNTVQGTAQWDTLSLGMSQDYVWAIEEGASMVRVGSALFDGLEG